MQANNTAWAPNGDTLRCDFSAARLSPNDAGALCLSLNDASPLDACAPTNKPSKQHDPNHATEALVGGMAPTAGVAATYTPIG